MDAQRMATLEARIATIESVQAIQRMHGDYVRAIADRRFEQLVDWFTRDALIDMRTHGRMSGRASIAAHFAGMARAPINGATYLLTSPSIDMTGIGTADGTWTWHRFTAVRGAEEAFWEEGHYACTYGQEDDGNWRFSSMRFRVVRPHADDQPAVNS